MTSLVASFNKNNGMLDYKCYLVRTVLERMTLRHARTLLDNITLKVN